MNRADSMGKIEIGYDANLVLLDESLEVKGLIGNGYQVFGGW